MSTPIADAPGWILGTHPLLLSTAIATHADIGITVNLTWSHDKLAIRRTKPLPETFKIPVAVITALQAQERTLP